MAAKAKLFKVPPGETTVTVSLICPVNSGPAKLHRFLSPPVKGHETHKTFSPSLTFLLEHPSGRKLVWDLGIRKDYQNYSPRIAQYIPTTGYTINVEKNVIDILEEHGIQGKDIEAVVWRYCTFRMVNQFKGCGRRADRGVPLTTTASHWHWDHIGDPSTFPASADLIVGPGFREAMVPGAPATDSPLLESDYA
ncbi:hypothetical protein VTO42DRAFT_319 [Malbranchea cinnamomea]